MLYTVKFFNPSKEPPKGMPRFLCRSNDKEECRKVLAVAKLFALSYALGIEVETTAPKKRSPEQLAKARKTRLVNKMKSKYGLFADDFIAAEIQKRPNYFEGKTVDAPTENEMPVIETTRTPEEAMALMQEIGIPAINPELEEIKKKREYFLQHREELARRWNRRQELTKQQKAAEEKFLMSEESLPLWNA